MKLKFSLILLAALTCLKAHAFHPEDAIERDKCFRAENVLMKLVAKISAHQYEVSTWNFSDHWLLRTRKATFHRSGALVGGIKVKFLGYKRVPMENGFHEEIPYWEECPEEKY